MKKSFVGVLMLFMLLLVACGAENESPKANDESQNISDTSSTDTSSSTDTPSPYPFEADIKEDDFVYKIYTEQDVYEASEEPVIVGELTYVGDQAVVEIGHAETPLSFYLEEKTRNVKIDMLIREIGATSKLKKDVPLTVKYDVSNGFVSEDDKESLKFFDMVKKQGFPPGEYIISGHASFYFKEGSNEEGKNYNLENWIGFIVRD